MVKRNLFSRFGTTPMCETQCGLSPNAGPMLAHCLRRWTSMNPANTEQSPDVVSMAGQRQRRWANIETVLGE